MNADSDSAFEQIQQQTVLDLVKLSQKCGKAIRDTAGSALINPSRRDFIKAGAATLAAAAAYQPTVHRLAGRLRLAEGPGRVSLQVDSQDVFVIDEGAFTGRPHVGLDVGGSRYSVWLENARIAGSASLADLHMELWEGLLDWQYRLTFSEWGFVFRGNLASWLQDGECAWSRPSHFHLDGRTFGLEADCCESVTFSPDWTLCFEGGKVRARAGHRLLDAGSAALQVPQSGYESMLREGGEPAALLRLTRGANQWQIEPNLPGCEYGIQLAPTAFDTVRVESTERGAVQHAALLAEGQTTAGVAVPIAPFEGIDGSALSLPLANLRYAAGLDDMSEYLAADIAGTALHFPGLSLELQNASDAPGFQVAAAGGASSTSCQPAVTVSTQLPGALVQTAEIPDTASLPLTWGKFWCKVGRFLHLDSESRRACLSTGNAPLVVKVVRPQDFVNLKLEFHRMQFHCHGGDSFLQPVPGKADEALVVVCFPPQHLHEECFHAKDSSCGPATLDNNEKPTPPLRTRISGDSRLVFRPFAKDDDVLPFTTESLLDWSAWQLVVTDLAKPPVNMQGEFSPDGRIETDFICDFTTARITGVDRNQNTITIDQNSEARYTRLEIPNQNASGIIKEGVQLLSPTHLKLADVTGLQADQECILSVPCNPLPPEQRPKQAPQVPSSEETAIELPYRLVISPNASAQFQSSKTPDPQSKKRVELWHSRLKSGSELEIADPNSKRWQAIRAVWSPDFPLDKPPDPFPDSSSSVPVCQPMNGDDRKGLVRSSTTFNGQTQNLQWFNPFAMPVKTLALSSLGGSLDGKVNWEPLQDLSVEGWEQRTAVLRDNLVKLQFKGFLICTGHRCVLQKLTQREWWIGPDGKRLAILVQRCQLLFPRPRMTYPAIGQRFNSRDFPFKSATITIEKSPYLDETCNDPAFMVPHVCGRWFAIPLELVDLEERTIKCELPMVYVRSSTAFGRTSADLTDLTNALKAFAPPGCTPADLQSTNMRQQKIAYAPVAKAGDTAFATDSLAWCYSVPDDSTSYLRQRFDQPPWYPKIQQASLQLGSVQVFSGKNTPSVVSFPKEYVENGFPSQGGGQRVNSVSTSSAGSGQTNGTYTITDSGSNFSGTAAQVQIVISGGAITQATLINPGSGYFGAPTFTVSQGGTAGRLRATIGSINAGEGFLKIENSAAPFEFPGEKGGGIILPKVNVGALSRKLGVLGGDAQNAITNAFSGKFDACQFFPRDGATLLGAIRLCDVITLVANISGLSDRVPKLVQQELRDLQQTFNNVRETLQNKILNIYSPIQATINGYAAALQSAVGTLGLHFTQIAADIGSSDATVRVASTDGFSTGVNVYALIEAEIVGLGSVSANTFTITRGLFGTAKAVHKKGAPLTQDMVPSVLAILGDGSTLTQFQQTASQAISKIDDVKNLPQLREYFVQQIAQNAGVSQQDIENLRGEFNKVGQDKLRALRGAFDKATENLTNAAVLKLDAAVTSLQEGVNNADLKKIGEALRLLKGILEQLLATASTVKELLDQVDNIHRNLQEQLTYASVQVKAALDNLKQEAQNAKWNLQAQVKQDIQAKLQEYQQQADAALSPLRAKADAFQKAAQDYIDSTLKPIGDQIDLAIAGIQKALLDILSALDLPTGIRVSYDFSPQLQDAPADDPIFKAARGSRAAALDIHCFVEKRFDGSPTTSQVSVVLTDFELLLFPFAPFIVLPVNRLSMTTINGAKPAVTVDVDKGGVKFLGPLNFVEQLQSLLHFGSVTIVPSPSDIRAVAIVNLPNISTGAFNLEHVSFNTSLILSLVGDPVTFRFAFAERSRPCLLSFGIFGGTCFVALELRSQSDFVKIEAALDFGAVAALDLGVASGDVHIFGGFYFKTEPNHLLLQGYIRAGGELNILGIVSMSIEFFLALAYESRAGKAWLVGECTVTVEVHVLFFSASVGLTLRKEFSGGGGSDAELNLPAAESAQWARLENSTLPGFARFFVGDENAVGDKNMSACTGYGKEWIPIYREHYESYAW
jgi:TAT (twin-arginine translocation) pathway signal sequence